MPARDPSCHASPTPSFPPSLMCCVNSYAHHGDNNKGVTKPMNAPHRDSPTVAVAVSGGVDSLCAVVMLHNAGFRVLALHGLFLTDGPTVAPAGLAEACATLGVPLHVAD
ncbi:hypothetical protein PZH39_16330, partial [Desulfovibrio desulfuricans]|nr:hypothetical protein [Desulfovibrio desulfuricans]